MIAEKISAAEKRQALDLVLRSQTFARSDRLRSLLRYVCEAEIEGRQDNLHEYVIGVEALGKPRDYSPNEDSCVRSRVYELRQRLEKFYASEAPDAPLRIDVPKGSYIPRFVPALALTHEPDEPAPMAIDSSSPLDPVVQPPRPQITPRRLYSLLAAAFVAGALLTYATVTLQSVSQASAARQETAAHWTPELEAIWQPLLDPKTPTLVSFQTRLFLSVGPVSVRDWAIDSLANMESSEPLMKVKKLFGVAQVYENRNYTDFGSANACLLLARLLGSRKPDLWAKRSVDVNWEDLRHNNVIILGKPRADPDIARLLPREHFVTTAGGKIRNLQPNPGEPAEWQDHAHPSDASRNWTEKYTLVTMMPALVRSIRGQWRSS